MKGRSKPKKSKGKKVGKPNSLPAQRPTQGTTSKKNTKNQKGC